MKERPILMSAPMVLATLQGRKTQTRRIVKPLLVPPSGWEIDPFSDDDYGTEQFYDLSNRKNRVTVKCPYGKPGDRLWVRETWATIPDEDECSIADLTQMTEECGPATLFYRADPGLKHPCGKWRPSIHMPKWASRITLEITEVRVQRLRDISENDVLDEGLAICPGGFMLPDWPHYFESPQDAYKHLWESLHGKGSWDANPYVWAISFKRVERGEA